MSINIRKKLLLILLTTTGLSLTGCAKDEGHVSMYAPALTDICLEENNETNVDEVMSIESKVVVGVPGTQKESEVNLIDALDKLELYTRRLIILKEAGITTEESNGLFEFKTKETKAEELSEEQKEQLASMSIEEVTQMIESYKHQKQKDIVRARMEQQLKFLFANDQSWLQENGAYLLESGLMRILKANICSVSGLEPENYKDCKISADDGGKKHKIVVTDKKTGKAFTYYITDVSGVYYEALEILYDVQFGYVASTQTLAKGLNIMKECIVTSPDLNEDRVIVPTITKEESIQKVKSYN